VEERAFGVPWGPRSDAKQMGFQPRRRAILELLQTGPTGVSAQH